MRGNGKIAWVLATCLAGVFASCEAQPAPDVYQQTPALYVPATAVTEQRPLNKLATNMVLPGSDADFWFIRGQREAYGSVPEEAFAAYSIYTYDQQIISAPNGGWGYRYRTVVQQGLSAPAPP